MSTREYKTILFGRTTSILLITVVLWRLLCANVLARHVLFTCQVFKFKPEMLWRNIHVDLIPHLITKYRPDILQ